MTWAAGILDEFGRSIGIEKLSPDPGTGDAVQLTFGNDGILGFEPGEDELLVYLAQAISPHDPGIKARALAAVGPDRGWSWPVHAGTRGADRLVFLVRLSKNEVSLATLEKALDLLVRLHESARQ